MKVISFVGTILLLGVLRAEELAVWPPHWMCAEARGIVLGERVGTNRVKVLEWLMPPADGEPPGESIEIKGLENHSRVVMAQPDGQGRRAGKSLRSQRLVCFLENKGGSWSSLSTVGAGSSGLFWIEDGKCFRYEQWRNPGPLNLVACQASATEEELREDIVRGLGDRRAWNEAQKIAHPQEKAIVLASYLLSRTSPEGDHGTYRQRVRRVLPKLGRHAVEELIEILRGTKPEDQLGDAVLILHDLGPRAKPAVPELVKLLELPAQVHPVRVIEALGRIGDPSVVQDLLPFFDDGELQVRAEVAIAMARFRYQDSAPRIAEALPPPEGMRRANADAAYALYSMLRALHELDPKKGAQFTRKYVDLPAMKQLRDLLDPLLADEEKR